MTGPPARPNPMKNRLLCSLPALLLVIATLVRFSRADVQVEGWGDLRGFRLDGQLFSVATSLKIISAGGKATAATAHWQERELHFALDGTKQIFTGKFGFRRPAQVVDYQTTVQPLSPTSARIEVQAIPEQNMNLDQMCFCITVPLTSFAGASANLIGVQSPTTRSSQISTTQPATDRPYLAAAATAADLQAAHESIHVDFDSTRDISIRDHHDPKGDQLILSITLHRGPIAKNQKIAAAFTITATGDVDHTPAHLAIDASKPGSPFDGLGGNFVFSLDTPDVDYDLQHLPIIWARMSIPLAMWEPTEIADPDPESLAANDQPGTPIRQTLDLANILTHRHIPLIFTIWVAPEWALNKSVRRDPFSQGRIINPKKWDELCNSIASYLLYARKHYGVEPKFFSFNETDIGITIHFTPDQYRDAIKRVGASFAAHGLSTKFLLGDVSKPPPVDFIKPASLDPQAMKYVGAISFHSWNGATPQELSAWHDASQRLHLPLLVAEGGTDSDSYHYPHVWAYPWYAIDEAAMYLDVLTYSQPASVLPWEMTPDYGLVDFHGPVPRPSMRFWCLKQLASTTPPGACELPISTDIDSIHAAALYDSAGRSFCVHLANTAAARQVTITGIPPGIDSLQTYITGEDHSFAPSDPIPVRAGTAQINLRALSYLTLTTESLPNKPPPPSAEIRP